jgi:hypothetical protein
MHNITTENQNRKTFFRDDKRHEFEQADGDEKFPERIQDQFHILGMISDFNLESSFKSAVKNLKQAIRELKIDNNAAKAIRKKCIDIADKRTGYTKREYFERLWDERPEFPAPGASDELTPVMEILDQALLTSESVPPMRSLSGHPVEVELREPAGLHELTAEGSNDSEAEQSRLPPPKSYILARHNPCTLALAIERYARFYVDIQNKDGSTFRAHKRLQAGFIAHYLEFKKSKLPKVASLMTMPLVLPNGKLLASEGLNRDLKTVFCIEPKILQLLPQGAVSDSEIAEAMRFLTEDWLADVPTDYAGKCTLIALALSVLERQLLGERPAFFVTAGKRGTGKTTAVTMIALALTAKRAAAAAWSFEEEERRKAVFAAMLQSVPLIVWDNIKLGAAISCATIEKTLTSLEIEDRVLGESRMERTPCTTIQVFTGNNITPKGDMASRSLNIRLNTERPDPENREFKHPDPIEWTLAHRGAIIKALYTILLGNPRFNQLPKNREAAKTRFKQWWHLVGAPIEYAAKLCNQSVDFGQMFLDTEAEDEDSVDLSEVLSIFRAKVGREQFKASQVVKWLTDKGDEGNTLDSANTLQSFFITERNGAIPSAKSMGKRLKKIVDAPVWAGTEEILTLKWKKLRADETVFYVEKRVKSPHDNEEVVI